MVLRDPTRLSRRALWHAAGQAALSAALAGSALLAWATTPPPPDPGQTGASAVPVRPTRPAPRTATSAAPKSTAPAAAVRGPSWKSLTPEQQRALAPLKPKWNRMGPQRKQKWLKISKNFASLSTEEQARMHNRMTAWIGMSRKQREQARINYAQSKDLSSKEKAAQWEAYQSLTPEQKRKLATRNPAKPAGVALVTSTSPNKLTPIPPTQRPKKPASPNRAPPQRTTAEPAQAQPDRP